MSNRKRLKQWICLASLCLTSANMLHAQTAQFAEDEIDPAEENWYQIEIIVFKHLEPAAVQEETWPNARQLKLDNTLWALQDAVSLSPTELARAPVEEVDNISADELTSDQTGNSAQDVLLPGPVAETSEPTLASDSTGEVNPLADAMATEDALTEEIILEPVIALTEFYPPPPMLQLAANESLLKPHARRLKNSRPYRVIYQQSWRQQLLPDAAPSVYRIYAGAPLLSATVNTAANLPADTPIVTPVVVDRGLTDDEEETTVLLPPPPPRLSAPAHELDGTISFFRQRFLHVKTDLWLRLDEPGELDEWGQPSNSHTVIEAPLSQKQRLKADVIQYLDHPLYGVLVYINRWQPPTPAEATLAASQAATDSPAPATKP
ncbi:MAG: CsiV family protein [Pseudomonadales bacterium]